MKIVSAGFVLLAVVFVTLGDYGSGFVLLISAWLLAMCHDSISWGKGW